MKQLSKLVESTTNREQSPGNSSLYYFTSKLQYFALLVLLPQVCIAKESKVREAVVSFSRYHYLGKADRGGLQGGLYPRVKGLKVECVGCNESSENRRKFSIYQYI